MYRHFELFAIYKQFYQIVLIQFSRTIKNFFVMIILCYYIESPRGSLANEQVSIINTDFKTLLCDDTDKLGISSTISLLQTIERLTKVAKLVRRMLITKKRLHINLFSKIVIKKGIFDIDLK